MTLSDSLFDKLKAFDTCTMSNAIERLNVRLRNEGFVTGALRCRFRNLEPMLGYAVTGRIRSASAPISGRCYYHLFDFWQYLTTLPAPRVMVFEDVDPRPGLGAMVGEMHAVIGLALNCVGYVTNGSVGDLAPVKALGFHLFSGSVSPSHAYAHLIEFGEPVTIGGLKISPGDLIHGDRNGVLNVPFENAERIPEEAEKIIRAETELKEFCQSPRFSLDGLAGKLEQTAQDCK
jgi:4-hydroxy-4-methyl-2-oxoglutarate aldolase